MFTLAEELLGRGALLPGPLLAQHLLALALVWASVLLPGFALALLLRCRVGLAGVPLFGVVYWSVALYLLPFAGGLDVAGAVAVAAACAGVVRWWRAAGLIPAVLRHSAAGINPAPRRASAAVLLLGSLPYLTMLLHQHVPRGMDASMHTTAAALIAKIGGLPHSFAPFLDEVPFPPINLGLPAVASVAIRRGAEPAATILAAEHLTFTLMILATWLLLRWWLRPGPAAVLAVASVWLARASQSTLGWGGFPTVLSVAVGVFAARLLLQHSRSGAWRLSLAAGASIAAIPLIHGVGGATWLYCVGPWVVLAALWRSRGRAGTMAALARTTLCAAALLAVYRLSAPVEMHQAERTATQAYVAAFAPAADGWRAWPAGLLAVPACAGSVLVLAGWGACGFLALRRQWGAALLLAGAWASFPTLIANARWDVLPGSFLLYSDRALYYAGPVAAVSLALAWRAWPGRRRLSSAAAGAVAIVLLVSAGYFQVHYQRQAARDDFAGADGWDALVWAREHLFAERDFVAAPYNSIGSYLPAVAGVGCTGWHHHHFVERQWKNARPIVTYDWIERGKAPAAMPPGEVVFHNRAITILVRPARPW